MKRQMLKDRGTDNLTRRSTKVFEDDLSSIKRRHVTNQPKDEDKDETIGLEKNIFFPEFTPFSGEDPKPKGEASHEEWR